MIIVTRPSVTDAELDIISTGANCDRNATSFCTCAPAPAWLPLISRASTRASAATAATITGLPTGVRGRPRACSIRSPQGPKAPGIAGSLLLARPRHTPQENDR